MALIFLFACFAMIILMYNKAPKERSELYKSMYMFVLSIMLMGILYFVFYYMESVAGKYLIPVGLRVLDYILCYLLIIMWSRFVNILSNQASPGVYNVIKFINIARMIIFVPITVFFMDGYYHLSIPGLGIFTTIANAGFSFLVCILLVYQLIKCLPEVHVFSGKLFITIVSVSLIIFEVSHIIIDNGLLTGSTEKSAWANYSFDPTSGIMMIITIITIIFVYRSDFSPLFSTEITKSDYKDRIKYVLDTLAQKHHLTNREREVMEFMYEGYTNPDIAEALHISRHTVKHHVHNTFEKLDVSDRMELVHLINIQK